MNAATDLIPLDEISADKAPAIYGANILDRYVEAARAEVTGEVPDLTTRKGRERIASLAAQVARSKTAVEKPGREYLKRIKELPKAIEAELREFVQQMDALRDEVRQPLNDWQAAEDARVAGHQETLDWLAGMLSQGDERSAEELQHQLDEVEAFEISSALDEFEDEAARSKDKALTALREQLSKRQAYDAEQAEQAAAAERQRQADEQARADAEAKAREADKAHKAKINRSALEAFVAAGIPEECAKQAITLIAERLIPAISINY